MEELYLDIINHLSDGIYFVDLDRKILFWNKAAEKITGYSADEVVGKMCQDTMLNHIDEEGRPLCKLGCPLFSTMKDANQRQARVFVRHKSGYRVPIRVSIFPMEKDGVIYGAIEVFTKDTPKVYDDNLVEKLSNIAMHDQLTKLPNRRYLESFLEYKIDEFRRFGRPFSLVFADVDDFGKLNNEYGHDLGDQVLKNIGQSILRYVRRNDLVGRWGGEEFVGIYSGASSDECSIVGEKFRHLVANTDVLDGDQQVQVTVSVGVTAVRADDTVDSILERADSLMYQSKKNGKDQVSCG